MSKQTPKLNPRWVRKTRDYFKKFLKATKFPHPVRNGKRGSEFDYPEWLIMFIAILSVKAKVKNYLAIHRITLQYWNVMTEGMGGQNTAKTDFRTSVAGSIKKNLPPTSKTCKVHFSNIS